MRASVTSRRSGVKVHPTRLSAACLQIAFVVLATSIPLSAIADELDASAPDTIRRYPLRSALNALQVSELAAENDLPKLSLQAFRDALRGGLPFEDSSSAVKRNGPTHIDPAQTDPSQSSTAVAAQIEFAQRRINELWRSHRFDGNAVYETLVDVVLPPGAPTAVLLYRAESNAPLWQFALESGIGVRLLDWATEAQRLADLQHRLSDRPTDATHTFDRLVLLTQTALRRNDQSALIEVISQLQPWCGPSYPHTNHHRALSLMIRCVDAGLPAETTLPVLNEIADAYARFSRDRNSQQRMKTGLELILLSAQLHFKAGQRAAGIRRIGDFVKQTSAVSREWTRDRRDEFQAKNQFRAAAVLFAGGATSEALHLLSQTTSSHVPADLSLDGKLIDHITDHLKTLDATDQYRVLRSITFGTRPADSLLLVNGFRSTSDTTARFVSTASLLVLAAVEAGQLPELQEELQRLTDESKTGNNNAAALLTLVCCETDDFQTVTTLLQQRAEAIGYDFRTRQKSRDLWTDIAVLQSATRHDVLGPAATRLSDSLMSYVSRYGEPEVTSAIRRLQLDLSQGNRISAATESNDASGWLSASQRSLRQSNTRLTESVWASSRGIISRVAGASLHSRYLPMPLTGDFDFVVEVSTSPSQQAAVSYGGIVFEPGLQNKACTFFTIGQNQRRSGPLSTLRDDGFSTVRFRIRDGKTEIVLNDEPLESGDVRAGSSPWIGLTSKPGQMSTWRFARIEGHPTVPDEVALSDDPELRGWTTRVFAGSRTPIRLLHRNHKPGDSKSAPEIADWTWSDGVIRSPQQQRRPQSEFLHEVAADALLNSTSPCHLQYDRPLRPGETVSWEFQSDAAVIASPTLGATLFDLTDETIRPRSMHVMANTPAPDVASDAGVARSLGNSRHPAVQNGWNAASLSLTAAKVTLTINERVIGSWPLPDEHHRQFGLYHDKRRSTAAVRNVVLRGAWPQTIPETFRTGITSSSSPPPDVLQSSLAWTAIPPSIVDRTNALPPAERYQTLLDYVVPANDTQPLRIAAAIRSFPPLASTFDTLDSPVTALLSTAVEGNRLASLEALINERTPVSPSDRQVRRCVLVLIALRNSQRTLADKTDIVSRTLDAISTAESSAQNDSASEAESAVSILATILAFECLNTGVLEDRVAAMLKTVRHTQGHLQDFRNHLALRLRQKVTPHTEKFAHWDTVTYPRRDRPGRLSDVSGWQSVDDGTIRHRTGPDEALFLNVPLSGRFTVECRLVNHGGPGLMIGYNARSIAFQADNDRVIRSELFGRRGRSHYLNDSFTNRENIPLKLQVDNGQCTIVSGDRRLFSDSVESTFDPWLFFQGSSNASGTIQNFRVSGDYEIPREISLDCSTWFRGWSPWYFGESVGAGNPWTASDNVISAKKHQTGQRFVESVLQYHRPIFEDGTIRYEFFFEDGQTILHPAIGRLAFLLQPDGVYVHQMTSTAYQSRPLTSDNMQIATEHQLVTKMPFRNADWNAMEIEIAGDTVLLRLNGTAVYRRPLPAVDTRLLGLFHFRDQSDGRVRNIVWRGNWPDALPPTLVRASLSP